MTDILVKLRTPSVPNFVLLEIPVTGVRQDGFKELPSVPVGSLTNEQLDSLADSWRKALFANADRMRRSVHD